VVLGNGPVLSEKYLEPLFAAFKDVSGHYLMRSERDGFGGQPRLAEDVCIEAIADRDRIHADYQRLRRYDSHRPHSPDNDGYLESRNLGQQEYAKTRRKNFQNYKSYMASTSHQMPIVVDKGKCGST
jgi:hypothetical protein